MVKAMVTTSPPMTPNTETPLLGAWNTPTILSYDIQASSWIKPSGCIAPPAPTATSQRAATLELISWIQPSYS